MEERVLEEGRVGEREVVRGAHVEKVVNCFPERGGGVAAGGGLDRGEVEGRGSNQVVFDGSVRVI